MEDLLRQKPALNYSQMKSDQLEITSCANAGCGWACCSFQKKSHIIILPEELDQIAPEALSHLTITEDSYLGGKKVSCSAKNTATCDGGYKPVHCGIYPLWAKTLDSTGLYRSNKCPLPDSVIDATATEVLSVMQEYCTDKNLDTDSFERFLSEVYIDNYTKFYGDREANN